MSDDFIFDGKHSLNDMGIYTEIVTRPLFAEPKTVYGDIAGRDGEYNFTLSNPAGRMHFKPRIIELQCHLADVGESATGYINKISKIASWLATGENKVLKFENENLFYYKAHAANLFNIENITDFSGIFPLVFKCDPFRYSIGLTSVLAWGGLQADNPGYYVNPKIKVTGNMPDGFTVMHEESGKHITVNTPVDGAEVVFDMERMTVEMNGVSILHKCEGEFFELPPGSSKIVLTGIPEKSAEIQLDFQPRYL